MSSTATLSCGRFSNLLTAIGSKDELAIRDRLVLASNDKHSCETIPFFKLS